jgi:hypothetical protein
MWLVVAIIVLAVTVVGCLGVLLKQRSALAAVQTDLAKWDTEAKKVEAIEAETASINALAAPTDAKVKFIEDADASGEQFWDAFDKVNRYVYAKARMLDFTITPPTQVTFDVEVPDTTTVGRFVLNLIRCPDITSVNFGGTIPSGPAVGPAGGTAAPSTGAGVPMGAGPRGMAGMPGGMPGGAGRGGGGAAAGGRAAAAASGPIRLAVTAQLVKPISIPAPGGGAPAAGGPAAGGMPGGMPGGGMPGGRGMPSMGGAMPGGAAGAPGPSGGSKGGSSAKGGEAASGGLPKLGGRGGEGAGEE